MDLSKEHYNLQIPIKYVMLSFLMKGTYNMSVGIRRTTRFIVAFDARIKKK